MNNKISCTNILIKFNDKFDDNFGIFANLENSSDNYFHGIYKRLGLTPKII